MRVCVLIAALVATSLSPAADAQTPTARPNVILVMTDDMGWGDLSGYGAVDVKTPNIDSIGERAVRSGPWKLVLDAGHAFIFDLRTDLGERHDLANRRQDLARKLRPLLIEWERDVDAEAKAGRPPAPR